MTMDAFAGTALAGGLRGTKKSTTVKSRDDEDPNKAKREAVELKIAELVLKYPDLYVKDLNTAVGDAEARNIVNTKYGNTKFGTPITSADTATQFTNSQNKEFVRMREFDSALIPLLQARQKYPKPGEPAGGGFWKEMVTSSSGFSSWKAADKVLYSSLLYVAMADAVSAGLGQKAADGDVLIENAYKLTTLGGALELGLKAYSNIKKTGPSTPIVTRPNQPTTPAVITPSTPTQPPTRPAETSQATTNDSGAALAAWTQAWSTYNVAKAQWDRDQQAAQWKAQDAAQSAWRAQQQAESALQDKIRNAYYAQMGAQEQAVLQQQWQAMVAQEDRLFAMYGPAGGPAKVPPPTTPAPTPPPAQPPVQQTQPPGSGNINWNTVAGLDGFSGTCLAGDLFGLGAVKRVKATPTVARGDTSIASVLQSLIDQIKAANVSVSPYATLAATVTNVTGIKEDAIDTKGKQTAEYGAAKKFVIDALKQVGTDMGKASGAASPQVQQMKMYVWGLLSTANYSENSVGTRFYAALELSKYFADLKTQIQGAQDVLTSVQSVISGGQATAQQVTSTLQSIGQKIQTLLSALTGGLQGIKQAKQDLNKAKAAKQAAAMQAQQQHAVQIAQQTMAWAQGQAQARPTPGNATYVPYSSPFNESMSAQIQAEINAPIQYNYPSRTGAIHSGGSPDVYVETGTPIVTPDVQQTPVPVQQPYDSSTTPLTGLRDVPSVFKPNAVWVAIGALALFWALGKKK
jgi:hypothetical protein